MRYALFSDVHANLPALEAVLEDVKRRSAIAATFHLGDLVGYAPWPDETVALIRGSGIPGVAGNYDSTVGSDYKHCGCRYEDPRQEELSHISYDWTRRHVSPAAKQFLADRPDDLCLKMASLAGAKPGDVIAFGHTHIPWHRQVGEIHFVNTGSVGRPKDGDWRAGYVLLEAGSGVVQVESVRVEYDVERAIRGIRESELPDEFAEYLRDSSQ